MDVGNVNSVAQTAEVMAQILQIAATETTEMAEKLVKVNLETQLATTAGIGEYIDIQA